MDKCLAQNRDKRRIRDCIWVSIDNVQCLSIMASVTVVTDLLKTPNILLLTKKNNIQ